MAKKKRYKWHVQAEISKFDESPNQLIDQIIGAECAADVRNWLAVRAERADAWLVSTKVKKLDAATGELKNLPVALPSPPPPAQAYKPPCTYKLTGMNPVVLVVPPVKVIGGES